MSNLSSTLANLAYCAIMLDGDTIFALATGEHAADVNIVDADAAEVFAQAILRAVYAAKPVAGIPAISP
jgi:L-aminopeptidase/D-esterase-like protein